MSKELKTDIRREVIEFESTLAKTRKPSRKIYILSKQLTNNRINALLSGSDKDLSTPAEVEITYSLNTYFQSVFVFCERWLLTKFSLISSAEPVLAATMIEKLYSHRKLYIEKLINWRIKKLLVWTGLVLSSWRDVRLLCWDSLFFRRVSLKAFFLISGS